MGSEQRRRPRTLRKSDSCRVGGKAEVEVEEEAEKEGRKGGGDEGRKEGRNTGGLFGRSQ